MSTPLPNPPKIVLALALALLLASCQVGSSPRPVPSVPQIGSDLKCSQGDHGFEDQQAGWGFCYPGTWKYTERSQASESPPGLDLTFDVTYVPPTPKPCPSAASAGSSSRSASPCPGDFAFMILSTYERGGSADLFSWMQANLSHSPTSDPISWGNSVQAVKLADGRRVALTPHHVVVMDLHSGLLNLETEMSTRLPTWKFSY